MDSRPRWTGPAPIPLRRVIARSIHRPHALDGKPRAVEELLDLAAGEESQMRAVEQPGRFVSPVPLQQRPNDAVVPHVGDAGDQIAVGRKPLAGLLQQPLGLAEVLEDVGADDRVERPWRDLQVELLDVAGPNLVQPLPGRRGGRRVELDAETSASCRCLIASPSRPAPQPMSSTRRAVRARARDLGPGVAEIERIGVASCWWAGRPAVPGTAWSGDQRRTAAAVLGGLRSAPPTLQSTAFRDNAASTSFSTVSIRCAYVCFAIASARPAAAIRSRRASRSR